MWPYIGVFSICLLLFKAAEKIKLKQRKYLELCAVILLCILAALRSVNIGTDTKGYLQPLCNYAINASSFSEYMNKTWAVNGWQINSTSKFEIGFTLLIYVIAKITCSVVAIQFVVQLLIIYPIYYVLKHREDVPIWLGMLTYCLLLYNPSLNMIRQAIAMSFSLLSLQFWICNNKKKSYLSIIVAILFHYSGVITFLFILIYNYVNKSRKKDLRIGAIRIKDVYVNTFISIIAGFIMIFLLSIIFTILSKYGFIRFVLYVSGDIKLMPNQIILRLPAIIMFLYCFKSIEKNNRQAKFFLVMLIYEVIVSQLTSISEYSLRIAQYFSIFNVISYPLIATSSNMRKIFKILIILYLGFYWWFYFVHGGSNQTIPYELIKL